MVGTAGFEPTTPTPPVWCATRLRYAPKQDVIAVIYRRVTTAAEMLPQKPVAMTQKISLRIED